MIAVDHHQALVHGLQYGFQLVGQVGEVQLARDQRLGRLAQFIIVRAQRLARLFQAPILPAREAHQIGRVGEDQRRTAAHGDRLPAPGGECRALVHCGIDHERVVAQRPYRDHAGHIVETAGRHIVAAALRDTLMPRRVGRNGPPDARRGVGMAHQDRAVAPGERKGFRARQIDRPEDVLEIADRNAAERDAEEVPVLELMRRPK